MILRYWKPAILLVFLCSSNLTTISSHVVPIEDINTEALNNLTSYVDLGVDPCESFYSYACGNWVNVHKKEDPIYLGVVDHVENAYNQKLKKILEGRPRNVNVPFSPIFTKLVTFHESCRQQDTFNIQHYMDILTPMENVPWPINGDSWNPGTNISAWAVMGRLAAVGFDDLLFHVTIERHNATDFRLELDKYQDNSYERTTAYQMSLNSNKNLQIIGERMNSFVLNLYKANSNNAETKAVEMTFEDLQQEIPNIDFISYFSALRGHDGLLEIPVVVKNLPYFRQLGELVKTTTKDTLLHILKMSLEGYLKSIIPHDCVYTLRQVVTLALDYLYDLEIYSALRAATDATIQRIFKSLKQKFLNILQQHSMEFSNHEMEYLKEKIEKIKLNIGNLPQGIEDTFYSQYFDNWDVRNDNFYSNHLEALRYKVSTEYALLKSGPLAATQTFRGWAMGSPTYSYSKNLLTIPFSYLNVPTFHKNFNDLFLYAGLGNTLGHEILHAFDIVGLTYNSDGIPSSLFADVSSRKPTINNSLQCLRKISTCYLEERMADFSGFGLAYDAYFQQSKVPEFVTQTNFTNKQLFYIKFAQFFCGSRNGAFAVTIHDLPATRVNRIVANSREMNEVFKCAEQEEIFIEEKCNMW